MVLGVRAPEISAPGYAGCRCGSGSTAVVKSKFLCLMNSEAETSQIWEQIKVYCRARQEEWDVHFSSVQSLSCV